MTDIDKWIDEAAKNYKNETRTTMLDECSEEVAFKAGARAMLEHLSTMGVEFDFTYVYKYAQEERFRSAHDANNFATGASYQHAQLSALIAARDGKIKILEQKIPESTTSFGKFDDSLTRVKEILKSANRQGLFETDLQDEIYQYFSEQQGGE